MEAWDANSLSSSIQGEYGERSSPRLHFAESHRTFFCAANFFASWHKRVFPMPASPEISISSPFEVWPIRRIDACSLSSSITLSMNGSSFSSKESKDRGGVTSSAYRPTPSKIAVGYNNNHELFNRK